jgi:DNA-binding XRE family transcriptional regulator
MLSNIITSVNKFLHLNEVTVKFSEVMIYYGYNQSNVARALGVSRQTITHWKRINRIPYSSQCQIEIVTQGKLKADKNE